MLSKAQEAQKLGEYNKAINFYKKALEKGGDRARVNLLIAENYRISNRISEAARYYGLALQSGSKDDRALYYYALGLKSQGKYTDAKIHFQKYIKVGLNKQLVEQAKVEVNFINNRLQDLMQSSVYYIVTNVGTSINTPGPEYGSTWSKESNTLWYTGANESTTYSALGTGFTDIYLASLDPSSSEYLKKDNFPVALNKRNTHEACATRSPDGGSIVFVRSNDGSRKGSVDTDLYITELRDEIWSAPVMMTISDPKAWESTPCFSYDGKTLYFASNRRGGLGGIDLWKSEYSDSLGWAAPTNLGSPINTPGNEVFPVLDLSGNFYFSSDGHPGLGMLDVFRLEKDTNGIRPVNLGVDINSSYDDFGITFTSDSTGFFASNRAGGIGDDDIYAFTKAYRPPVITTKKFVANLQITVFDTDTVQGKKMLTLAQVMLKTEVGVPLDTMLANNGVASFGIDTSMQYWISAEKEGYFAANHFVEIQKLPFTDDTSTTTLTRTYRTELHMQKLLVGSHIVLENIYYDYKKADIRPDAEPDLISLINLMKKNPNLTIELGSHTDSRADDAYNLKLSKARATSAVNYLIAGGIEKERIKPIGYGESQPLIPNAVTEEEHQKNRRTEFKIVSLSNNR